MNYNIKNYNIKVEINPVDILKNRGGRATIKHKNKKKYNRKRKHKNREEY